MGEGYQSGSGKARMVELGVVGGAKVLRPYAEGSIGRWAKLGSNPAPPESQHGFVSRDCLALRAAATEMAVGAGALMSRAPATACAITPVMPKTQSGGPPRRIWASDQ